MHGEEKGAIEVQPRCPNDARRVSLHDARLDM